MSDYGYSIHLFRFRHYYEGGFYDYDGPVVCQSFVLRNWGKRPPHARMDICTFRGFRSQKIRCSVRSWTKNSDLTPRLYQLGKWCDVYLILEKILMRIYWELGEPRTFPVYFTLDIKGMRIKPKRRKK